MVGRDHAIEVPGEKRHLITILDEATASQGFWLAENDDVGGQVLLVVLSYSAPDWNICASFPLPLFFLF